MVKCANCKKELELNTLEDIKRMKKEAIDNFGNISSDDKQVCDDCYNQIIKSKDLNTIPDFIVDNFRNQKGEIFKYNKPIEDEIDYIELDVKEKICKKCLYKDLKFYSYITIDEEGNHHFHKCKYDTASDKLRKQVLENPNYGLNPWVNIIKTVAKAFMILNNIYNKEGNNN